MKNQASLSYEQCVENLFSVISPLDLKETILYIYMSYLIRMDTQCIPKDFSMMAEDIFLTTQFPDEIHMIRNRRLSEEMERYCGGQEG